MLKKYFYVKLPVTAVAEMEVFAENAEEAINKALDTWDCEDLEQIDVYKNVEKCGSDIFPIKRATAKFLYELEEEDE